MREPLATDEWRPQRKHRQKARFGIEIRFRPGRGHGYGFRDWTAFGRYRTIEDRDRALAAMNKKDDLFEYRAAPD